MAPSRRAKVDVVVAGGGIAGVSVAYHLVRMGASVLLVDREDAGRATAAGAGILSPETTKNPDPLWVRLTAECGRRYRELAPELESAAAPTGYARCGLLTLALADWDIEEFDRATAPMLARQATPGPLSMVTPAEAASMFPPLGEVTRALFNSEAARIDGALMACALRSAARRDGLEIAVGSVDIARVTGPVEEVTVGDARIACGALVVAGGAWSPGLAGQLGVALPIVPWRGQIVHVVLDGAPSATWPIVQPLLGHYLVPWPGGRVAVGATVEPEAGFDSRATVAGMRQLLRELARVAPGLRDAAFVEVRVGLRPACEDGLPVLGRLPGHENVYTATGYGADGLLLSPYCGHLVAADVVGGASAAERQLLDAFGAARFAR